METANPLADQLSAQILQLLESEGLPLGAPLTERALSERLNVSRTPIRRSLRELHERGYVDRTDTGRYRVGRRPDARAVTQRPSPEDQLYAALAGDRLEGSLDDRIFEAELMRRYDVPRSRIRAVLIRAAQEGWAEQAPGQGWIFLPVLTSMEAYRASYRYRLLVEPAGILEPTFVMDVAALQERRAEQQGLVDGRIHLVTAAEHFSLNEMFHETIYLASNNEFIIDELSRINRRRRLMEYRQELDPEHALVRCREHVQIADLLLADRREEASLAMRDHLHSVSLEKTTD